MPMFLFMREVWIEKAAVEPSSILDGTALGEPSP